jgi:arginase
MPRKLSVIGVPTSAGAFAPGQERAPEALRAAGLLDRLRARGVDVTDLGDSEPFRWRPDPSSPLAQNANAVAASARDTAFRVDEALKSGAAPLLVLGGDCTVELGIVSGHTAGIESFGLVYFDVHPDLNTPHSTHAGAFDWMGVAHMLAIEGTDPRVSGIGPRAPLLDNDQLLLFAWGDDQARSSEHDQIALRGLQHVRLDDVAADPPAAARGVLEGFATRFDRLLVHFDVDTVDFTDAPLSENTGRNEGLSLADALSALAVLVSSERLSALTITELNPLHGADDGSTLDRFVAGLVDALAPAT